MKDAEKMALMSSDTELLEKAANNKLNSPETEEFQIAGSPFKAIREKDGGWFAAWGQGKMTEEFNTLEDLLEWIENNYWNFLITVLTMAMDSRDLYKITKMKEHEQRLKKAKEKGEKAAQNESI